MKRRLAVVVALAVGTFVALLLMSEDEPAARSTPLSEPSSSTAPVQPTPSPPPTDQLQTPAEPLVVVDSHGRDTNHVSPDHVAEPTSAREKAMLTAAAQWAEQTVTAMARPKAGVSDTQWLARLEPYISPRWFEDFTYVDPTGVPFTKVSGKAKVYPTGAPYTLLTLVRVPTDAGPWAVEVEFDGATPSVMTVTAWSNRGQ